MRPLGDLALLITAAFAFAAGGLCMKWSAGLRHLAPTVALFALFGLGAALQAIAMRRADLGTAYIFVLGAEAVLTMLLSVFVLGETCPPGRLAAVALVVIGIAWLRAS